MKKLLKYQSLLCCIISISLFSACDSSSGSSTKANDSVSVTAVSLDNENISLAEGQTASLTATLEPVNPTNQNVTWSSSNTGVATVSNGTVTGIAPGSATITVTTEDGGHTDSCDVIVTAKVAVTSVSLEKPNSGLLVNSTCSLAARILPLNATNQNASWSSSNTAVATVSEGVVTGVAAGSATITVTTADGSFTDTCDFTVSSVSVSVTSVSLNSTMGVTVGSSGALTATIEPANATNTTVSWSSSNTAVATVSGGIVTGVAAGSATITVTTADGSFTDTCTVIVGTSKIGLPGEIIGAVDTDGDGVKNGYTIDADLDKNPDGLDTDDDGLIDTIWDNAFVTNFGTPDGYASSGYGPGVTDQNYTVKGDMSIAELKELIPDYKDTATGTWNIQGVIVNVECGTLNNDGTIDESTIENGYCWIQDTSGAIYLDGVDLAGNGINLGVDSIGKTLSLTVTAIDRNKSSAPVYTVTAISAAAISSTQQPIYVQNIDDTIPLLNEDYDPDTDPNDPLLGCVIRYTGVVDKVSTTFMYFSGSTAIRVYNLSKTIDDIGIAAGDVVTLMGPLMAKGTTCACFYASWGITTSLSSHFIKH